MATNAINSEILGLWYSTDLVTPAWKEIVCGENFTLDGSTDVNTRKTFCGTIKSVSPPDFNISGSGVANSAPGATTQGSANQLAAIFQDGTPVKLRIANRVGPNLVYRETRETAFLSSYSENYAVGEMVAFDYTFTVTGDFKLAP